ncbi:glycosyltransferase family 2 protein [Halococcoides cellulosivorans]|uniref:Glycosyltransferase family 2 protein n=1 Tax=Halococcoides cellulosivorans TaxID=1679096 RepID=A0A2R4X3H7_9EURY|nr:glycosyltransferase family 2 protein [Halococcoides cellulosivorans]AWB28349.1 glycosyltransferase family 2 protein [Halococcoides cellulosivorans]
MYRDHTVAAVVPAYNESGFVGNVIDGLPEFVDRAYVIDDGSTDDTWAEIQSHAAERNAAHDGHFEELVVGIRHDENRGVGGAIKTGYQRARDDEMDVTVVLGGDDQMDPAELTRYIDPIVDGVADYTKGNRFARPEDRAAMPRFRLIGNVVLSYLTKIASGYWGSMDSQNGYTAISLAALRATDIEGMYEYYGYCNDLLVRLNVAGVTIADVPRSSTFAYQDGWKSHIDYREYIPRVSAMLLSAFLWRLKEKYLLERYDPLAPLYALGGLALGVGTLGTLAALGRRKSIGSWLVGLFAGALTVLYAGERDRRDNRDLEAHLDPAAEDPAIETGADAEAGDAPDADTADDAESIDERSDDDGVDAADRGDGVDTDDSAATTPPSGNGTGRLTTADPSDS